MNDMLFFFSRCHKSSAPENTLYKFEISMTLWQNTSVFGTNLNLTAELECTLMETATFI